MLLSFYYFFILITESLTEDYGPPKYLQKKYGTGIGSDTYGAQRPINSYTKTKTQPNSYSNPGRYSYGKGGKGGLGFKGGCSAVPTTPENSGLSCSRYSGCRAKCIHAHQFPNGKGEIQITCTDGKWSDPTSEWDIIPGCEPICFPACLNNGICIAPNQCNCPENFSGPQCQFESKPCINYPTLPMNSKRSCRSNTCTIECMKGHEFPDGSAITTMACKDGNWVPTQLWPYIPDCEPTCTPPCQNGGNCLSFNVCQCPQEYRGPQCQYSESACSARNLKFNGGYNCSGTSDYFSCSVYCPEGVSFEYPPENVYTCLYDEGVFSPTAIPQCVYQSTMKVIPLNTHSHTVYETFHGGQVEEVMPGQMEDYEDEDEIIYSGVSTKTTKIKNHKNKPHNSTTNVKFVPVSHYGSSEDKRITIEKNMPKPGSCLTWSGAHFKTFDGHVYSVKTDCSHTMVRDVIDDTFSIIITNNCEKSCYRQIKLFIQDKEYSLRKNDQGIPIFESSTKTLPIPAQLPGLRVEMVAHYVVLSLDVVGAKIKWDGKSFVQIDVNEALWNRTGGLCGPFDGDASNDLNAKDGSKPKSLSTFVSSWKVDSLEDVCESEPVQEHACKDASDAGSKAYKAAEFCQKILEDKRFGACQQLLNLIPMYLEACTWDYCACNELDSSKCACDSVNVFVKTCAQKGITGLTTWRDKNMCPMDCTGGRVYMSCAPKEGQEVCGATREYVEDNSVCEEGCYCLPGTVLHKNECIARSSCPCRLRGKEFSPGLSVPKDCNTCTCVDGQWICTQVSCGARCSALGDPHYITFDGKRYDFMGQCSYYLVKGDNFSIEAENVACSGSISEAMSFPPSISSSLPSCTKTVTIKISGQTIKLKQNHALVVNGIDITKIPFKAADVTIRSASSIFLVADLPNGIEVWWDGVTRAYVDVPASFKGHTKGLCGTFNENQKDDFLTPEDDVEQSVVAFANKWKTSEKCNDIPEKLKSHPCYENMQNKATAEKHCKALKSQIFADCHWFVDPEPFYSDCLYDMCSCEMKLPKCLCPMLAAYAAECAPKGVKLAWRLDVRECGISCPPGQKYQVCGNSCARSCYDIATRPECKQQCVEGCNCPEGETLDDKGECIPIGQCPCEHEGLDFPAGYKEVRPSSKGLQVCSCINALWSCKSATPIDIRDHPQASDLKAKCNATRNFVFTTCESVEPVTCKNMHDPDFVSASVCHPGCECKEGHVLDTRSKYCVKPEECPCHHGGRSYKENSIVQSDCNTCKCKNGKWDCTDRQCSAECSAWGDSHFKSFDGKMYDYQGQCDYVLAKGALTSDDTFDVTIQNVPCGTLGVSCSKSVTIKIGSGAQQESITLMRDKKVPATQIFKRFTVRHRDLFVIIEAADLGLIIHWDKGTRVYVKVDSRWKNKVKGLCGNYNDNEADDFQTPSGGLVEASAQLFGDSWKLQSYCPEAEEITDTCESRPDRKVWALKECGILKSAVFAPCHSEVPFETYLEKCIFDSCACDQGGDCECLCTALAAYSQECNNRGVPIKWRSQELCPIQCDERCSNYSPCVSTCPVETCDNLLIQSPLSKLCKEDSCVEGCEPKLCPPDHIYSNSSLLDCIPKSLCKHVCMEIEDVTYYEGDLMEEDDCHSCYCSRGKKSCKGQPCPSKLPVVTTAKPVHVTNPDDTTVLCKDGWTEWINQDKITEDELRAEKESKKFSDVEPLPDDILLNNLKGKSRCNKDQIVNIECRTVKTHLGHKETGLDVECSLENGLICSSSEGKRPCPDFEIRVFCKCFADFIPQTTVMPCDPRKPTEEYPKDCHKFYQCVPGHNAISSLVENNCGKDMMYNPQLQICDWPSNVISIKPECEDQFISESIKTVSFNKQATTPTDEIFFDSEPHCPYGQVFDACAIQCDKLCLHYLYLVKESGKCTDNKICEEGCVSAEKKLSCPAGMVWVNNESCVQINDCMCTSHDGDPIKPGTVFKESDCMICQCIDNYYTCDKSACKEEELLLAPQYSYVPTADTIWLTLPPFLITTVTPPKDCSPDMYIDLIQGDERVKDSAFTATSMLSSSFAPQYARINSKVTAHSGGSWAPKQSDQNQYLQIDLPQMEPIYGIVIKGSPLYTEFVTSFKVTYSQYGDDHFNYALDRTKEPQIFRGSLDGVNPVQTIFSEPIEAKMIRIHPQTWQTGISLRVELIGCGIKPTTVQDYEFITMGLPKSDICVDPLGIEDGSMSNNQITVSSEYGPSNTKKNIKLSDSNGWRPMTNSPSEFIEFDFMAPRNITGFISKGGPAGWITAFNVKYSHTGNDWNPILDAFLSEKTFLGNFDEVTPITNSFQIPILATYIKIVPIKWHKNIQLRLELLGCYQPYPSKYLPEATRPPSPCNECPGISNGELEMGACRCKADSWWDGEYCVTRSQCPCLIGHIPYAIGTVFEKEDCSQCICKLGGLSHCTPKFCDKCEEGLKGSVTSTCSCVCLPCPEGTKLCPTSNICINETSWCDGIRDCPDDEIYCPTEAPTTTPEPIIKVTIEQLQSAKCPILNCPPGYKAEKSKSDQKSYISTMFSTNSHKSAKASYLPQSGIKGGYKNPLETPSIQKTKEIEEQKCPEYSCVSDKPPVQGRTCSLARCPPGFNPEFIGEDIKEACQKFECIPTPEPDAICNVTGRTFNTFDKIEYKYDICNHVLVRDLENLEWDVTLKKNCTKQCTRNLIINHEDHKFILHPDLSVEFDGYRYTVTQTKQIGSNSQFFSISRLGNTLLFVSNKYGFWVIWDDQGNVKIGVSSKLKEKVDGLCGYFNYYAEDDKRRPDGNEARTTVEFGDSWARVQEEIECEAKACPIFIQNKAWDICNQVKSQILSPCAKVIDVEAFISRCVETTCSCLENAGDNSTNEDTCRCKTLERFVVDCMTATNDIELTDWRLLHDCPVACESPLVYHDCYRRRCEPTCETISNPNTCPKLSNVCFPGCYCPPGLVRKGDSCIKSSTCKDCECNVLPHLQYVTYDDNNFTINGNCVYVMSRDVLEKYHDEHQFQVLITNAACRDNPEKMCVGKVTILYQGHKIHIFYDVFRNKLKLMVDAERIEDLEEIADWAKVRQTKSKHFKIILFKMQVEVSVYFPSLGVSVKAPSHKYSGKLEGLCGDCDKDPDNDMKTPKGLITQDPDELGPSWLYDKLPGMTKETCSNKPKEICQSLPINEDPCVQLLDSQRYGQCHPLLDPSMFIEWCRKDICGGHPERACVPIGSYARECLSNNFCILWHSDLCPAQKCADDQEYKPCGTSCPKTCESLKETSNKCVNVPTDGCFCPQGKVLMNNTCVEERMCLTCDNEDHHSGDKWEKDACTKCECEGTSLKCETQHCPNVETVCEQGYTSVKLQRGEKDCCDKFICVPAATVSPTCDPPQQLNCAPGQVMKLDTKNDGCQQFICQCKAIEDCEIVDTNPDDSLEPGMVKEIDETGCCPQVVLVCKAELCPKPPQCEEFYVLKESIDKNKCCPSYLCESPEGCCIDLEWTAGDEGGERERNKYERQHVLKQVNETWNDGPCRNCQCYGSNSTGYHSVCSLTECPSPVSSPDYVDYDLISLSLPGECCPDIKRAGCKHNGKVYKIGDKWAATEDFCTIMECIETKAHGLQKLTQLVDCDEDCDFGFKYRPALKASKECCGSCRPVGCVIEGEVKNVDEEWSSKDFCTNYICVNSNGSMQIQSTAVVCAEIPPEKLNDYVYESILVENECCKKHKMISCKHGDNIYELGDVWESPDKCKQYSCIENEHNELLKQESIETCNTACGKGWEYVKSANKCCGECVQTACLVEDGLKTLGETWFSEDNCTKYSCEKFLDQFTVNSQQETCPQVDDCPEENLYVKGCCKHCNITSQALGNCVPEEVKALRSLGLVSIEHHPHGVCKNKEVLKGFTECVGACHSSTLFNSKTGEHESVCSCCKATKYAPLIIELTCEDGYKFMKQVAVPSVCNCEGCSENKSGQKMSYQTL